MLFHIYGKIKVISYDSLPLEKTLTLHDVTILKSVFNKDKTNYYYNTFLEIKVHMDYSKSTIINMFLHKL